VHTGGKEVMAGFASVGQFHAAPMLPRRLQERADHLADSFG